MLAFDTGTLNMLKYVLEGEVGHRRALTDGGGSHAAATGHGVSINLCQLVNL